MTLNQLLISLINQFGKFLRGLSRPIIHKDLSPEIKAVSLRYPKVLLVLSFSLCINSDNMEWQIFKFATLKRSTQPEPLNKFKKYEISPIPEQEMVHLCPSSFEDYF